MSTTVEKALRQCRLKRADVFDKIFHGVTYEVAISWIIQMNRWELLHCWGKNGNTKMYIKLINTVCTHRTPQEVAKHLLSVGDVSCLRCASYTCITGDQEKVRVMLKSRDWEHDTKSIMLKVSLMSGVVESCSIIAKKLETKYRLDVIHRSTKYWGEIFDNDKSFNIDCFRAIISRDEIEGAKNSTELMRYIVFIIIQAIETHRYDIVDLFMTPGVAKNMNQYIHHEKISDDLRCCVAVYAYVYNLKTYREELLMTLISNNYALIQKMLSVCVEKPFIITHHLGMRLADYGIIKHRQFSRVPIFIESELARDEDEDEDDYDPDYVACVSLNDMHIEMNKLDDLTCRLSRDDVRLSDVIIIHP